ncbi:MAG: transcriptional repressor LexA [Chloroflexi bacterium]|nr:transcriptional repressor LexA [Chloroflexota bacterium]
MKGKLSPRQQGILAFIRRFMDEHQFPPTVRDIQAGCDISSTSVVDYNLQVLQREGNLRRLPEVSRGIELLDGGARRGFVNVPVLASIAAGVPIPVPSQEALDDPNLENIELPTSLTQGKENVFALRVKGTSMIDAFIADGDLVLLEPVVHPDNGDMVAAWLLDDEEVTLKRFYLEGDTVRLQPANSAMEPISVPAEKVAVRGRVVGVVRTM